MRPKVYISCPWGFSSGLDRVAKYLSNHDIEVSFCSKKDTYQFSKIEQADYVVFVLEDFKWQEKLENISKGMLSELIWCLNNRKPFFLAYVSTVGLAIYSAEIGGDLVLRGVAGTSDNLFKIIGNPLRGFIIADGELKVAHVRSEKDFVKECASHSDIDFELTSEEQKSYFY